MINDLCGAVSVSDPFRIMNPESREYTYNPSGTLRKNRSRIDFYLITENLYEHVEKCTIAQGFCRKTFDSKPVFLNFKKN
jgi:exonuclease III